MNRLLLVSVALVASAVGATTLLALDVAGLTTHSDLVVRGTIVSVAPHWSGDNSRIYTDAEVQVSEVWKGPSTAALIAMQPGGEIGEVGQRIHGVATFTPGEEVVLFLERRGPRYTVTGMAQGKFRIEPGEGKVIIAHTSPDADLAVLDPVTHAVVAKSPVSLPLEELKAQVKAALPKAPVEPTTPKLPATKVAP